MAKAVLKNYSVHLFNSLFPVPNQPVFAGKYTDPWLSIIPRKEESHPVAIVFGRLALRRDIYQCNITIALRYKMIKHGKTSMY